MIFKRLIVTLFFFYLACFQYITPVYAVWDCDGTWLTPSNIAGDNTNQVENRHVPICEDGNPAPQPEVVPTEEIVPSRNEVLPVESVISNTQVTAMVTDSSYSSQDQTIEIEPDSNWQQYAQIQAAANYEEPVYPKTAEVGGDWIKWIKWLLFFVILCVTLTPLTLILFANNAGTFYAVGAFVGAEKSKEGAIKGAAKGIRWTTTIFFICVFLGPYGALYCIYHPLQAYFSEADKTFCCAMTWLGKTTISKKAISTDGHWLAEVSEQMPEYFGLGDRRYTESNTLSVINLTNGEHVRWPQTGQKLLGVNPDKQQIEEIAINDGILIRPTNYLTGEEIWYDVQLGNNFLRPLNAERIPQIKVRYQQLDTKESQTEYLQFIDVLSSQVSTIQPDMKYDRHYLSYDGRVVALVQGPSKGGATDGLISQLFTMVNGYLSESWKIEFWNVSTGKKIATYSGHGINQDAWEIDGLMPIAGHTKFLESSQDGRFWYMIKSDGFIHVFDMSKHIPSTVNEVS